MKNWLSHGNRKYRKKYGRKLLTFGLPAYKSKDGFVTCPGAKECIKGCYARQGFYLWSPVTKAQEARLKLTRRHDFMEIITAEIQRRKPKYVRIHDAGDFYSVRYLNYWIGIALQNPEVFFFTYTKMIPLVRIAGFIPPNFRIVFSEGGVWDNMITEHDQTARVFKSIKDLNAAGFVNASHEDMKPIRAGVRKLGLVYHGISSRVFNTGGCHAEKESTAGVRLPNRVRKTRGVKGSEDGRRPTAVPVPSV